MAFKGLAPELIEKYIHTPASKPPQGVTPDFEDLSSLRTALILVATLFTAITTFFVGMRVYTRYFVLKKMWWDDYLSVIAWVLFIGGTAVLILLEDYGAGAHQWNLTYYDLVRMNYVRLASSTIMISKTLYIVNMLFLKLSILLQILRIFVPDRSISQVMFWTIVQLMVANTVFYIIEFSLSVKNCTPRERSWNTEIPGHCIGGTNVIYTAGFNVISDIIIFILPLPSIWRLHMSLNKKIGVSLIFSTGLLAVVASMMRLYYSAIILHARDESFYALILACMAYAEIAASVVVGCMPVLPKFCSHTKSAWTTLRSKVRVSDYKSYRGGAVARDCKSWHDPKDESRERSRAGAAKLQDHPFDSNDRLSRLK